jgi:2-C-methyl-D-erythritol 4-phosphate cytidylyltransferase
VPEVLAVVLARRRTTPGSVSAAIRRRPAHKERFFGAAGGTRPEALALALEVAPPSARVLVHDDTRPLVDSAALSAMLAESARKPAGAAAAAAKSTYKEIVNGRVRRTIEREQLFDVRSPWVFERSALEGALALAARDPADITELAVCQKARIPVLLLRDDYFNVPVTDATDIEFADLLLARHSPGAPSATTEG